MRRIRVEIVVAPPGGHKVRPYAHNNHPLDLLKIYLFLTGTGRMIL